eukprot:s1020_g6.t1
MVVSIGELLAFTFLVPTLLTLAKFAQPQQTTTPPGHDLPMPMVDVPAATTIFTVHYLPRNLKVGKLSMATGQWLGPRCRGRVEVLQLRWTLSLALKIRCENRFEAVRACTDAVFEVVSTTTHILFFSIHRSCASMAAPNVYQPVGDPVGPPRQGFRSDLANAARNLGPALGILSAAAAFTFLVPTLLTLAKFAQPQQTTTPPSGHDLPKMPMVDVPAATTIFTAAPSTELITTTAGPLPSTTESEGKDSQLDVELDFVLKSQDASSLESEDLVTTVQRSIAQKAQVKSKYVDVTTRATEEGRHVHAVVRPPKGRTPGDLRGMLVTLKPLLSQALHQWKGNAALEVQPVQVSFIEAAKVTPLPTAAPEPPVAPVHHRRNSTGRVAMMFVLELQMNIEDLGAFDVQKYTDAFAQEVQEDRSLVMVVKTEFRTEVRYLVPHLLSKMQLRKALAEALHVPLFAVSVEPADESSRRLRAVEGTRELLCVVTTEDPASAETFAEMMKDPGEVVQEMRLQGLSVPLELKRQPWASVLVHTKLELRGKPPEVSSHFSSLLSQKLGVPVSADTIGVRQVLHQELLGTGSDAPPGPGEPVGEPVAPAAPAAPGAAPSDGDGLPAPLPLRANKVNYNNLLTSSHRFPPVLRYGHVGYVEHAGGKVWLDVVLRVDGYKPKLHALTGEAQGYAAALNVHAGTKADLEISLVPSEPNIEVEDLKIRQIYLQISDIEDPPQLLGDEVTLKSCQEIFVGQRVAKPGVVEGAVKGRPLPLRGVCQGMPGPRIALAENKDYFQQLVLNRGDLIETHLYDDTGASQGFGLWDVKEQLEKKREGLWARCRLVAVSDEHLKWWLTAGPGKDQNRRFLLHLCSGPMARCRKKKSDPAFEFHTDYFRVVEAGAITEKKVAWFKEAPAKDDIEAEISRLAGQASPRGGEVPKRRGGPLDFSGSDPGLEELPVGAAPPEGEDVRQRLEDLRRDVAKPKDKKAKASKERRKKKASGDGKRPAEAEIQPLWFGKRKAVEGPGSDGSSSSSSESSSRDQRRSKRGDKKDKSPERGKKKNKKKGKAKKKREGAPRRVGDRGPFGTGAKVLFAEDKAASISSEDDGSDTGVFQAAPSGKSKQLQLMEYAQKNPGRLASRLLTKMRTLLAREEGAMKSQSGQENLTPPTATSYFLTVLLPLHRDRLNIRVQREMRTIAKALDLIASGAQEEAADLLAQRMKALEMMIADQSWARAAHIELLPPEGATLVEADESWVATREHLQESKMRSWKGKGLGNQSEGKGKQREEKGKGKKGQKWSSKATWGNQPAEAEGAAAK